MSSTSITTGVLGPIVVPASLAPVLLAPSHDNIAAARAIWHAHPINTHVQSEVRRDIETT